MTSNQGLVPPNQHLRVALELGRKLTLSLAVLSTAVLSLAVPGRAQTPDEQAQIVMQQAVEAMGGAEAIGAVKSLAVRAKCKGVKGGEYTAEVQTILPDRTLYRETLPNQVTEYTLVGDVAWSRREGTDTLTLLTDPSAVAVLRQRQIHLLLANFVNRFSKHRVMGIEIRGGAKCHLMEMQDDEGQGGSLCFDTTTYLPVELQYFRPSGGKRVIITLEEWTEVGDVLFPVALTRAEGGETFSVRYTSLELDVVDPEMFQIPPAIQEHLDANPR